MNRIFYTVLILTLLLAACASQATIGKEEGSAGLLKVTDGQTTKSYNLEALQALETAQSEDKGVDYLGVTLTTLLLDAGFDPSAIRVVKAVASDGFSANYEAALFNRTDVLLAYIRANGPLSEEEAPLRMVVPGESGKLNPRMVVEIFVVR